MSTTSASSRAGVGCGTVGRRRTRAAGQMDALRLSSTQMRQLAGHRYDRRTKMIFRVGLHLTGQQDVVDVDAISSGEPLCPDGRSVNKHVLRQRGVHNGHDSHHAATYAEDPVLLHLDVAGISLRQITDDRRHHFLVRLTDVFAGQRLKFCGIEDVTHIATFAPSACQARFLPWAAAQRRRANPTNATGRRTARFSRTQTMH